MAKYLLELGTEELPYKFIPSALEQLKEQFNKKLQDNQIEFKNIITYGTPRRLCVIVEGISESQPDIIKKIKGPPAKAAFDANGNLTQAGEGFAKKQGLQTNDIYKELVGDIEYVFADVCIKGKKIADVFQDIVPSIIMSLQGSHFMRWADLDEKFSRPIRWIVSLIDNEEVSFELTDIKSSRFSRGHRFYKDKEIEISSPDTYLDDLYKAKVIVDQKRRHDEVIKQAEAIAQSVSGNVYLDPDLVEEVTYILEWPVPVLGSFDKKYLAIPQDVIVCVMASHQRYFPVFAKDNKTLLNHFITMANYQGTAFDNIRAGNQRVIKARLDDAIFFYSEDSKKTLASRVEDLKGVTFQKGLGTIFDKTVRIEKLAEYVSKQLNIDSATNTSVKRAAHLSKADLVTALVREFTELQGIIGGDYALKNGEDNLVSLGVKEHYMPTSGDGELANSITGQIVGISDKMDTICGVFAINKIPTGSADPLGLRRATIGIIRTLIEKNINLNISNLIKESISVQPVEIKDKEQLFINISEFIKQRLKIFLQDKYKYDVIEAAFGAKDPLANINDLIERIELLTELVKDTDYSSMHEAVNRIIRIIKTETKSAKINPIYLTLEAEKNLYKYAIDISSSSYSDLIKGIRASIPAIEKFFDDVLVMDENLNVRENRLALLSILKEKFLLLADFSKISI